MKRYWIPIALLALAGCSKISIENYGKIEIGMSYQEARAILGEPTRCDDVAGFQSCQWGDEQRNISLQLVGDRVVMRSAHNVR